MLGPDPQGGQWEAAVLTSDQSRHHWVLSFPDRRSRAVVVADGQLVVGQANFDHGAVADVDGDQRAGDAVSTSRAM